MIRTGSERRPARPQIDPEWLEIAAQRESANARTGAIAMIAALAIALAVLFAAAMPASAANLEYGPETEQAYMAACMRTTARAECQCRMEALQRHLGMESFLDAVEQGDDRALAADTGSMPRGRGCPAVAGSEEPAGQADTVAGEMRVQ